MSELRKAAQAVLDRYTKRAMLDSSDESLLLIAELRIAIVLDSDNSQTQKLIAEIDDLSPSHVNDEYGCQYSDTLIMYHACDIKAILDKYRSKK